MKINIASSHRFHLLDLARELEKLGNEVRFYSYVPTKRAMKFGLKKESSYSLFHFMLPFLALVKLTKSSVWSIKLKHLALDYYLAWFMKPCDVYIALGTVYKKSFVSAEKKFGATTILEWGSKHIKEQRKQFEHISIKPYPKSSLKRDLDGYTLANYISIPSLHVEESFLIHGVDKQKLLVNPYGVDLSMFYPTQLEKDNFDIIFVGGWRSEKGCDLLINLCKKYNFTLLHVGSIAGMDFPNEKNMKHIDSVNQSELVNYYSKAKIFVLPSRSEGLALVQVQAIACGLPIVCSKHTGGKDLREFLDDKRWILEMQEYTVDELGKCIYQALELSKTQSGVRSYSNNTVEQLTWEAYGKRYNGNLKSISRIPANYGE